jgi:hypothetical protein
MKKKLSRLLCALLVMTMVLAMVPAVSAADTLPGTALDPFEMYEGDYVDFGCREPNHTSTATYENVVEGVTGTNATKDTYVTYNKIAKSIQAKKTTQVVKSTKDTRVIPGYVKVTLTCKGCGDKQSVGYFRVYAKGLGLALRNTDTNVVLKDSDTLSIREGDSVVLDYSVLTSSRTTTFTEATTANQNAVSVDNNTVDSELSVVVDTDDQTVTVTAKSGPANYDGFFDLVYDEGTSHENTRRVKVVVNDGSIVTIKKGKEVVGKTGSKVETIAAALDETLTLTATTDSGSSDVKWKVDQEEAVLKALGGGKFIVVGTGEATIIATANKAEASVKVVVLDKISRVRIEGSEEKDTNLLDDEEMSLSDKLTLHVKVTPSGSQTDATHAVWSITSGESCVEFDESNTNPKLWTIDEDVNTATGEYVRLKVKKVGSFSIKVELGGKSDEITMKVKATSKVVYVKTLNNKTPLTPTVRNGSTQDILDQMNNLGSAYRYIGATTVDSETIFVPVEWRTAKKNNDGTATIYGLAMNEDEDGTIYDYSRMTGTQQVTATAKLSDDAVVTSLEITGDKETAIADDRVTLTANATVAPSNATTSYQWYVNGRAIKGETKRTLTYTIPKASSDSSTSYKFKCEVTASYKGDSSSTMSKEYTVSVSRDYAVNMKITGGKSSFTVGSKPEVEVTLTYKGSKITNPAVTWKLYDEKDNVIDSEVATISGDGSTATVTTKAVKNAKGDKIVIRATVSANGQSFSSSETITVNPAEAATVKQSVGSGAALKSSSITAAITRAAGSGTKVSYLIFNTPKSCKLTKSSSSSSSLGDTKCYVSTSSGQKLSDVYVKTSASSASVTYTAYDADDYVLATGTVSFDANDSDDTITSSGASFKAMAAVDQITEEYPEAEYVKLDLPRASEGKLYYDFNTISDFASEVKDSDKYYVNASSSQADVEDVYFLPVYGVKGKITIDYTAYGSNNSDLGTGKITLSVKSKTASSKFTDVTASNVGSWAADSIDFCADNDLVNGKSTYSFAPKDNLTRGQLVAILYRAAGSPSVTGTTNPFNDVKTGDYYYNAVLWAYKNDVVNGTGAGKFSPNANVTREQIAAILYRYMGSPAATGSLSGYTDRSKISAWATTAMQWAIGKGYITGTSSTTLDPLGQATRAQAAVMLHRFLTK